jgi:hypothetical protein
MRLNPIPFLPGTRASNARFRSARAFCRLDLTGALAAAALLLTLCIALGASTRRASDATTCASRLRRLGVAWALYASDNDDHVCPNWRADDVRPVQFQSWAMSLMSWTVSRENIDPVPIRRGVLNRYLHADVSVFKCASDRFLSRRQTQAGFHQRLRSTSMNGFLGQSRDDEAAEFNPLYPQYRQAQHLSDIPWPSRRFVFIEEHPDTLTDGWFINDPDADEWWRLPTGLHAGSGHVSFADGRVDLMRWRSRLPPVQYSRNPIMPHAADSRWWHERATERAAE